MKFIRVVIYQEIVVHGDNDLKGGWRVWV